MIEQFIIKKGSKMENKILNQEVEISTKDPSVKSLSVWGWLVFLILLLRIWTGILLCQLPLILNG